MKPFLRARRLAILLLILKCMPSLAQYLAQRKGDVVELTDKQREIVVSIAPSLGDTAFAFKVKGQNVLYFPYASLDRYRMESGLAGIPFLGPWANRLDEQAFYANGKRYAFNLSLGNIHGVNPIHGFLSRASWQVVELKADNNSASLVCRLEFYRHPDWMAQFPFAHTIEITHRLQNGELEVHTKIENLSTDPMPAAIGFHPYFRLADSSRDSWTIHIAARDHFLLRPDKIPTGETEPIAKRVPDADAAPLSSYNLDDVFGDLVRDASGIATFSVTGNRQKLEVRFGPNFKAAVVFSPNPPSDMPSSARSQLPADLNFICFEPMASITDAINLEHAGKFSGLQWIPPGGVWEESFWVRPSGF